MRERPTQTDPEVAASGQFPQPVDMFLGVDAGEVTAAQSAPLLAIVPRQPLRDNQVTRGTAAATPS